MRAAVVYFAEKQKTLLEKYAKAIAKGMEKHNVQVEVFNSRDFHRRLSTYQLVVIGTESTGSFGGKIPEGLKKFLISAGPVMNTKSYGFIPKKGIRCDKSLQALMKTMESEGMFLLCSDVLESETAAAAAGEYLVKEN